MKYKAYHIVRLRRDNMYRHRIVLAATPEDALQRVRTGAPMAAYWTTSARTPQSSWRDLPLYVKHLMSITEPAATINGWPKEAIL